MARRRPPPTPIPPQPPAGPMKRRSGGRFVEATWRGIPVIRSWPRKATKEQNAKRLASCQLFTDRVKAIKQELARTQLAARSMAKGSALLPRDVQMMLMATSYYGVLEIDGERYFPVPTQKEISDALDVLERTPGAIFIRTEQGWTGLKPGIAGQVLTLAGTTPLPGWANAPTGGGSALTPVMIPTGFSSSAFATKGQVIVPPEPTEITYLTGLVRPVALSHFRLRLYRLDGLEIVEEIATSPVITLEANQPAELRHRLPAPLTLAEGQRYAVVTSDITTTGTRANATYYTNLPVSGTLHPGVPQQSVRIALVAPQIGTVLEDAGDPFIPFCVAVGR